MSKKRRIYQVAKEFNISIDALTNFLTKANFDVHSHMSPVTDEMYEEVSKRFSKDIKIVGVDSDIRQKLREKKAIEEEKKRKELREYEEMLKVSSMVMTEIPRRRKHEAKKEIFAQKTPIEDEIITVADIEMIKEKDQESVGASDEFERVEAELVTSPSPEIEKTDEVVIEKEDQEPCQKELDKSIIAEPEVSKAPELPKEAEEVVKETKLEALPEILPEQELKKTEEPKKIERPEKAEKALELKVIRKIDAKKKERQLEEEELKPKRPKKKLKKKERLAQIKKSDKLEEDEFAKEDRPKKKKKKKKIERLAEQELIEKPKKKLKKKKKFVISDEEVEESIRQTFAAMEESARPKKRKKKVKDTGELVEEETTVLRVNEFITVFDLAQEMEVEMSDVIKKCMELGMLVTINQRLDVETIQIVADEFGYQVEIIPEYGSDLVEEIEEEDDESNLESRSPVVTIMGHVDHGKTSLLDYIRQSNIIQSEAGGITQHIGAYQVGVDSKMITFLDTPGHEAFTAMRARGAQATDIVILVVAADDSVMPQTVEAIDHAKAAGVPIVVAINKIDKSNANPDLIKKQLSEHGVLIEEWGGKYQCVEISAKTGQNVDKLLESILIEAEILELKANPDRMARGVVIESELDKGKGVIATILVQKGTLKIGDPFLVGQYYGKVRGLFDEYGYKKKDAGPSVPIQVIGFTGLPQAGDTFIVLESEKDTRQISLERQQIRREQEHRHFRHITLDEISKQIKSGAVKELSLIIKGDVDGSVEAISDSLSKLSNDEVTVKIIRKGVGAISESDVLLATASDAIVLGFQVRPTINAREIAKKEKVDLRLYKVIYDAIADVRNALEGLLEPTFEEENLATVEVRDTFRIPKVGTVAGCHVLSGKISRNDNVRLYREDKLIYDGRLSSLRRFKDDVKEVVAGFECGAGLENFDDIKVGDVMEVYKIVEIKRTLAAN
ncbi:MAG: translation initiation factor IF-2 [bacterium]|nr:MAG: translation initiation factor IF-2 [bacterium]